MNDTSPSLATLRDEYTARQAENYRTGTAHDFIGKAASDRTSKAKAIHARCWQCVGANEDGNARRVISECTIHGCGLWHVRPYQSHDAILQHLMAAELLPPLLTGVRAQPIQRATRNPKSKAAAIKAECHDCMGGGRDPSVNRSVADCNLFTCPLWDARPWKTWKQGETDNEDESEDQESTLTSV